MFQRKQSAGLFGCVLRGHQVGFTLIELMITLGVVSVLAAAAAPGFKTLIEDYRVSTYADTLILSLNLARSEAVKRGVPVTLTATSGNFANGWCVHIGADCATDANIIRLQGGAEQIVAAASAVAVQFDARGARLLPVADATVSLRPAGCAASSQRQQNLIVGLSGRVNAARGACL